MLVVVFFLTSVISVITGSTSLITVPAMIAVGVEPHAAVATNMLALVFMSLGGSLPFMRAGQVSRVCLPGMILLTLAGSALGAFVMLSIQQRTLQLMIAIAMVIVAVSVMWKAGADGQAEQRSVSRLSVSGGYAATFVLAVYGGFFSGGYVTMLTAAFVAFFGLTLYQSIATTKLVNVFSSAVATAIFLWRGMVNVPLGLLLGIVMFFGAMLGSRVALRLNPLWLRRIFVGTIIVLAAKILLTAASQPSH
jgi:uncharacterized protein